MKNFVKLPNTSPININLVQSLHKDEQDGQYYIRFYYIDRPDKWAGFKSRKARNIAYNYLLEKFVIEVPTTSFWDDIKAMFLFCDPSIDPK